jgi:hypothetical protein
VQRLANKRTQIFIGAVACIYFHFAGVGRVNSSNNSLEKTQNIQKERKKVVTTQTAGGGLNEQLVRVLLIQEGKIKPHV